MARLLLSPGKVRRKLNVALSLAQIREPHKRIRTDRLRDCGLSARLALQVPCTRRITSFRNGRLESPA